MDSRFGKTYAFVEARSGEIVNLWHDYAEVLGWPWDEDSSGLEEIIGQIHGENVRVEFQWSFVRGKLICFWNPIGDLFSRKMMRNWLETNFPNAETTNEANFHNLFR